MARKKKKKKNTASKQWRKYEALIARFLTSLFKQVEGLHPDSVGYGRKNLIRGASGFLHQIDVSIRTTSELHLIECKDWQKNVSPDSLLALAARIHDIQALSPTPVVKGALATRRPYSSGVQALAQFFNITLQVVKSPQEFIARYKDHIHLGVHDPISVDEKVKLEIV
jgi:hypothetical protein